MSELILNVLLPIYAFLVVGFIIGKIKKDLTTDTISYLVLYLFAPLLVFSSFKSLLLEGKDFLVLFLSVFIVVCVGILIVVLFEVLLLKKREPALEISSVFMNSGYLGIPFCTLKFGEKGLYYATAYMVITALLHFSIGIFLVSKEKGTKALIEPLKVPLLYFAVLGFALKGFSFPKGLEYMIQLAGKSAIPLMLVSVGISLSKIDLKLAGSGLIGTALRFSTGVAGGSIAVFLLGLEGTLKNVVFYQSVMPSAILNYVIVERFGGNAKVSAGVIFFSTILFPLMAILIQ